MLKPCSASQAIHAAKIRSAAAMTSPHCSTLGLRPCTATRPRREAGEAGCCAVPPPSTTLGSTVYRLRYSRYKNAVHWLWRRAGCLSKIHASYGNSSCFLSSHVTHRFVTQSFECICQLSIVCKLVFDRREHGGATPTSGVRGAAQQGRRQLSLLPEALHRTKFFCTII